MGRHGPAPSGTEPAHRVNNEGLVAGGADNPIDLPGESRFIPATERCPASCNEARCEQG
jgi:hypothetical protein